GQAIIRLKHMSLVSQVKLVVLLALPTAVMLFLLVLALAATGLFDDGRNAVPTVVVVLTSALISGVIAGLVVVFQIVTLVLLRLLPWRGPELKVEEPRNLSGIFE